MSVLRRLTFSAGRPASCQTWATRAGRKALVYKNYVTHLSLGKCGRHRTATKMLLPPPAMLAFLRSRSFFARAAMLRAADSLRPESDYDVDGFLSGFSTCTAWDAVTWNP